MDLSKLISELQKCQEKYGDIDVCIKSENNVISIETINYEKEEISGFPITYYPPYLILDE